MYDIRGSSPSENICPSDMLEISTTTGQPIKREQLIAIRVHILLYPNSQFFNILFFSEHESMHYQYFM